MTPGQLSARATYREDLGASLPDRALEKRHVLDELHDLDRREGLLQIIEIGRDGCNLRLVQAVCNRLHDG
jgi:hypothetical protein